MLPIDLAGGPIISLSDKELESFGLDAEEAEVGDEIHLIGRVRNVDKHDHNGVKNCRVEICLEGLADEHETAEEEAEEAAE